VVKISIGRVWLTAKQPIEIAPGVTLPSGTYSAKARPLDQNKVQYVIELTSAGLKSIGDQESRHEGEVSEYDVTDFVAFGRMILS
jgi:hypothetical protein